MKLGKARHMILRGHAGKFLVERFQYGGIEERLGGKRRPLRRHDAGVGDGDKEDECGGAGLHSASLAARDEDAAGGGVSPRLRANGTRR